MTAITSAVDERAGRLGPAEARKTRVGASVLVSILFFYLVLEATLPRYFSSPSIGSSSFDISLAVIIALGLAALGWLRTRPDKQMQSYFLASTLFGAWFIISAVASWDGVSIYDAINFTVWLLFIIPGLAGLLRNRVHRYACITAFIVSSTTYGLVVLVRDLQGRSVLDTKVDTGSVIGMILGRNRNLVSMGAVIALPLLIEKVGPPIVVRLRWILFGLSAAAVLYGGGRAGLFGLGALGLSYALLRRTGDRRLRASLSIALVAWMFIVFTQAVGGPLTTSTGRLLDYLGGEKEHSDELRELMARKAWNVAIDNPAFGVGYGNFVQTYHPVIEEASTSALYEDAQFYTAHSTYMQVLSESGFPGAVAFLGIVATLILIGVKRQRSPESRALVTGFAALSVMIGLDAVLGGGTIFLIFALLLGSFTSDEPEH